MVSAASAPSAEPAPSDLSPIRPAMVTVRPMEDGHYGIVVCWHGRVCMLRAVVVRRMLADAGFDARPANSQDGRTWELKVGPVPAGRVAAVIESYIW